MSTKLAALALDDQAPCQVRVRAKNAVSEPYLLRTNGFLTIRTLVSCGFISWLSSWLGFRAT